MATHDEDKLESEETEANSEPAIEIPSTSHQFLPRVHSAVPVTTPVFNSYQSVFQYWKDSVPKLYKYPSSEIEVVIYRKNGKIDKFKRSRNEDTIQSNSCRPTDSEEPAGNVSQLMHHLSNFQVTSTFPSTMDVSSLPNPGVDVEDLHSSKVLQSSPTSMPHIPLLYDESIDVAIQPVSDFSEPSSIPMRITPISSGSFTDLFRNNQSLLELNNYKAVPDIDVNIGSNKVINESIPLRETLMSRCDPSIAHRIHPFSNNCKFKFGFKLSNLRLKIDVGATEGISDETNNFLTDLSNASIRSEQHHALDTHITTSLVDNSTQSDFIENIMQCDKYVQNVPLLNSSFCQTLYNDKDICDAGCQTNTATTNTQFVQTIPAATMSDFNVQVTIFPSSLVQASQTDSITATNSSSQTHFSCISAETQTIVDRVDGECQAVVSHCAKNDQTESEILNPVISIGCQTVVQAESKSSQSGSSSLDPSLLNHFASQFSPAVESKEVQLSGSCCHFRERIIRRHFEKKIQMLLEKVNENAETSEFDLKVTSTSTPLPAKDRSSTGNYAEEDITEDVVNSLIHKFNTHVNYRRDQQDELRTEVESLSKVISLARGSTVVEDDFDYYDD